MSKHPFRFFGVLCSLLLAAIIAPQRALADGDDPPSRVARLSYTYGSVSFQPAGTDDWVSAVVNRPITTGDKLWADNDSRAELHIGSASIRMAAGTGFSFLNLSDNVTQVQLTAGSIRLRVRRLDENESFEVDTPNLAFSVLRPGIYKINVNEGGDTTIIRVRGGDGEVTGGGSAFAIHSREMGAFNGTDQLTADIEGLDDDNDSFDAWCADRDRHEDLAVSRRYVSPDVIGYEDLDDYGAWRPVPEYGMVWFPQTTVVGWAPYRYGHWAYVAPWGYTWIDDAPWGFAPFHYGRWINYGGVWGWVPAPPPAPNVVYVRPVYAPALVAWVGGSHFAVGVAVGGAASVGWFPLGPREVYVPSYPVSRTYITNVNVSNTVVNTTVINNYYNTTVINRNTTVVNNTVIQQTYVNQRVSGAVTVTNQRTLTSAQPVARNVVQVDQRVVVNAPVNVATPPVPPAKQAVLGTGAVTARKPPMAIESRAVVAKLPPPPPPASFAKQQQAIQANGGRPLAVSQERQLQPESMQVRPNVRVVAPAAVQNPQGRGNFRSAGSNAGGNNNASGNVNAGGNVNSGANANPRGNPNAAGVNAGGNGTASGNVNAGGNPSGRGNPNAVGNGNSGSAPGILYRGAGNSSGQPPANPNNPPSGNPPSNANKNAGNAEGAGGNAGNRNYNDRPPTARPGPGTGGSENTNANDSRHQQDTDQFRVKQNQGQPQFEQKPQDGRNLPQKSADDSRVQQLNQKSQPQPQAMEPKHDQQPPKFQDRPQERKGPPPNSNSNKGNSDKGNDKGKNKDKNKDKDDHKN